MLSMRHRTGTLCWTLRLLTPLACVTSTCLRCVRWRAWTFHPIFCRCWGISTRGWRPLLKGTPNAQDVHDLLAGYYQDQKLVQVTPFGGAGPRLYTSQLAGKDSLEITVSGTQEQTLLTAQFDNLGKGASGAAVQNMNIMMGFEETAGLSL